TTGSPTFLHAVAECLCLGQRLEPLERVVLDLADPLARDAEGAAALLKRARRLAEKPVAQLDHLAVALGERAESRLDVLATKRERRGVEGRLRLVVGNEVAERGVLLLADRLLQRDGHLRHPQDLAHLLDGHLELLGDLLGPRLAAEALDELALDVHDLVELLDHVHRDPDRARLVGDRARHGLAYPPRRVRGELEALAVVELLDRADEAERPLLDQVEEGEPAPEVALRDGNDEAQVRLDHVLFRAIVSALDPLREGDLLVGRQERHLADLAEVEPQGVEGRLDGEVELRCGHGLLGRHDRLLVGQCLVLLSLDELDRVIDEVCREVLQLLLGEIDVLDGLDDLVVRQEPLLLPLLDELVQLLDLRKSGFDREHGPLLSSWRLTEDRPSNATSRITVPAPTTRRRIVYTGSSLWVGQILDHRSNGGPDAQLADVLAEAVRHRALDERALVDPERREHVGERRLDGAERAVDD